MPYYIAIVEDAGPDKAIGIWFPDLLGCFSAGDDVDEALQNAEEALILYAEAEAKEGRALPHPNGSSAVLPRASAARQAEARDCLASLYGNLGRALCWHVQFYARAGEIGDDPWMGQVGLLNPGLPRLDRRV